MKQVLNSLKTGTIELADVPCPSVRPAQLLLRTRATLISAGTERMLVEFGRANLLDKARQQPERVKMVLDKVRTDGLLTTVAAISNKLDQPLALGYCHVGDVVEVGRGVEGFAPGDRVASNGKHAEMVAVPSTLCARVPDAVSDDEAAFAVIGSVALQGIRMVQPSLGEAVVVTGLGLIGLLTVQLLRAHGCRVLGLDFDPAKLALARQFGAEVVDLSQGADPVAAGMAFSRGRGVDAVIITASTKSSEPVHQAALMCRKRGRIVLVGVTGLDLRRDDFYQKELSFAVSCAYGPGRYDAMYEDKGIDYPVGFVRWTAQRNFEAVLDMMADGRLQVAPLVSHRFTLDEAPAAYDLIAGTAPSLGVVLQYPRAEQAAAQAALATSVVSLKPPTPGAPAVSFVGAGNYATAMLAPAFKAAGARLRTIASATGVSGVHAGRKFGFEETTTDTARVLGDDATDAVAIVTRHDSHASLTCEALRAGKHVFVEKPLALTAADVDRVADAARASSGMLMVGFNRRFAPHVQTMHRLLKGVVGPKTFIMTVNAGDIPASHWTQDPDAGGGRFIGEGCHFVDLLRFLAGAPIVDTAATAVGRASGAQILDDKSTVTLAFADGSMGTIHYLAHGHKSFPKERLEVFASGGILQLDNYRVLTGYGWPGFRSQRLWRQDKGQHACARAFVDAMATGGPSPIPLDELLEVARVTIGIGHRLRGVQ